MALTSGTLWAKRIFNYELLYSSSAVHGTEESEQGWLFYTL